jgi:hypothetical protein
MKIEQRRRDLHATALRDSINTVWVDPDCEWFTRHQITNETPWPTWLLDHLRGSTSLAPLGPSPYFAYIYAPVSWPTLLDQHPDEIAADDDRERDSAPSWLAIARAFSVLDDAGASPYLCVELSLHDSGRLQVFPTGLVSPARNLAGDVRALVRDTLKASDSTRPARHLHQQRDPVAWHWLIATEALERRRNP